MPKKENNYRKHVIHFGEGTDTHCRSNSCWPLVTKKVEEVNCKTCLRVVRRGKLVPEENTNETIGTSEADSGSN